MSILSDLLLRHGASLSEDLRAVLVEHARRDRAAHDFAFPKGMSVSDAQSGFILFEREFTAEPVNLFGQDVPSLAHTNLRIFRASRNANGDLVPDAEIFAAKISEKALTESTLLMNRGEGSPITVTRLGDLELSPHPVDELRVKRAADAYRKQQRKNLDEALRDVRAQIEAAPNRASQDLNLKIATVGYKIRDMVSSKFILNQHVGEMSAMRSEVLTEAAHAALHAHRLREVVESPQAALPSPEPTDWCAAGGTHPMVHAMLDLLDAEGARAVEEIILLEIDDMAKSRPLMAEWIVEDEGRKKVVIPQPRDRSRYIGWGDGREDAARHVNAMASLLNWATNPHLAETRAQRRPTQATIRFLQRSGSQAHLHSTLPMDEGYYFSMTVAAAWDDLDLGRGRIRSVSDHLLEVEIAADDLMTALRGHPAGHPVPCSLTALAGTWMSRIAREPHKIEADIDLLDASIGQHEAVLALRDAYSHLLEVAAQSRTGKKWLADLTAAFLAVEWACEGARLAVDQGVEKGFGQIDQHVIASAEDILASISKSLPADVAKILRLGRTSKE